MEAASATPTMPWRASAWVKQPKAPVWVVPRTITSPRPRARALSAACSTAWSIAGAPALASASNTCTAGVSCSTRQLGCAFMMPLSSSAM